MYQSTVSTEDTLSCGIILADCVLFVFFFFFQAEDGIRDKLVTGVQTCALPISTQVTVCCGSTEAMLSTLLAVLDPGDEVVIFEPYYENYGPDSIISGAVPRFVRLREPDWTFDEQELAAAFNDRTRAIINNTPNNPTGKEI